MRTRLFWLDSLSKHLIRQGLHKHLYTRTYLSVDGRTDGRTVCDYIINLLWSYIPFMVHEEKKFRLEMSSVTCQILVLLFVTHFSHIFEKILWQCCVTRVITETVFLIVMGCLRLKNFALHFSSNIGA